MPWTCESCSHAVEDDSVQTCPSCHVSKSAWTLHGGQTRQIVIGLSRFACLRGQDAAPSAAPAPLYPPESLVETTEARVVPKAAAIALWNAGKRPASLDLLVVRLFPREAMGQVTLNIEHAAQPRAERKFAVLEPPYTDVPFLFVAGPEELPADLGFPGVRVIDITEDGAPGWAPTVEVTALKRPAVELTVVPATPATQVAWLLEARDGLFQHDSCVLLPGLPGQGADGEGLALLVTTLLHARARPDMSLLVAGHTDTSGSPEFNLGLSIWRAEGAVCLLLGQRERWVDISSKKHEVKDLQRLLAWAARTWSWPCDPGAEDGDLGQKTRAALEALQERCGLAADGKLGPKTWGALFDLYQRALREALGASEEELARLRAGLRFADPGRRFFGLGELAPIEAPRRDAYESATNRRVEVLFFDEPPALEGEPPGLSLYDVARWRFERIPPYPLDASAEVTVTLDPLSQKIDARYRLWSEDEAYDRALTILHDAQLADGALVLRFPDVLPGRKYSLAEVSASGLATVVFAGVPRSLISTLRRAPPGLPPPRPRPGHVPPAELDPDAAEWFAGWDPYDPRTLVAGEA